MGTCRAVLDTDQARRCCRYYGPSRALDLAGDLRNYRLLWQAFRHHGVIAIYAFRTLGGAGRAYAVYQLGRLRLRCNQ